MFDLPLMLVVILLGWIVFILGFRQGKKSGYTDAVMDVLETGKFKDVEEMYK